MSNTLMVTLVEVEPLTRRHAGEHQVEIDAGEAVDLSARGLSDVDDFLMNNLPDIRSMAAKKVAASRVDYGSFGSDSDYLDRLDAVAESFFFKNVRVTGVDRRLYAVDAQYSDDQPWGDDVEAGDETEACFQARLELARNEGWEVGEDIKDYSTGGEALDRLLLHLGDFEIFIVTAVADLPETLLRELVEAAEAGDIETVMSRLKTDGRQLVDRASPPEPEADAPAARM